MTNTEIILTAIAGLLMGPIVVFLTRKKNKGVVVACPGCRTELKLGRLRNYKCPKCHEEVEFFDDKTKKLRTDIQFIKCSKCNLENVEGMKICIKCNSELDYKREAAIAEEKD